MGNLITRFKMVFLATVHMVIVPGNLANNSLGRELRYIYSL